MQANPPNVNSKYGYALSSVVPCPQNAGRHHQNRTHKSGKITPSFNPFGSPVQAPETGSITPNIGGSNMAIRDRWPTRKGSLATNDQCQPGNSPVAARLRETGSVLLGKTQTAEFGWKGLTETRLGGVTPNAWNGAYASSGSPGGGIGPRAIAGGHGWWWLHARACCRQ